MANFVQFFMSYFCQALQYGPLCIYFFHMAIGLKAFPMANFVKGILYGPLFV